MNACRFFCSIVAALLAASGPAQVLAAPPAPAPVVTVAPTAPSDIPGGAPSASLQAAALFAWQEFIALNWPAKAGQRDVPDTTQKFGAGTAGPLVWHTYRSKIEIFPGGNKEALPPHGYTAGGAPTFGYNDAPQYVYQAGQIQACKGQAPVAAAAWINLDEVSQIGLDMMYAGVVPAAPTPVNSNPQLIRFLAKANLAEYAYVAQNKYWFNGPPRILAKKNFTNALPNSFPPKGPYISFPDGTFEIKAGFRPITTAEKASGRFYTTRVRYYEGGSAPCYREDQWGLVGLHIIQKSPTAPAFVFATFEQADNLQTVVGGKNVAVEDENGNIVRPSTPPTTPALSYQDSTTNPMVSLAGGTAYCATSANPHLFYRNSPGQTGVPTGGNICVNQREHAIPAPVIDVNTAAHAAIAAYSKANGVVNSPWAYYKLVNVQAYPFNKTDIVNDPTSPRQAATYYQANIVVETNYTLQNFDGQIASDGAPTNFDGAVPYQNAYILHKDGTLISSFNMGGCMGCHGVASRRGSDFSFLIDAPPARAPEAPEAMSAASLKARFNATFPNIGKK